MRFLLVLLLSFLGAAGAAGKDSCVFCEIVSGERTAAIVYRDETLVAFLDHAPINPGHVLVVPVRHADNLLDLPPATACAMIALAQRIAQAIKSTDLKAEGIQVLMNTGKAAGQTVNHAHLHVIPRFAGDPGLEGKRHTVALKELEAVAAKIRDKLK